MVRTATRVRMLVLMRPLLSPLSAGRQDAQDEQRREGDEQQRHGNRCRVDRPVDLDLLLDVLRRDLGLARDVAADEDDRAVLTDGAREGQAGPAGDGGSERRQDDAAERRPARGAERGRRLLDLAIGLDEHRLDRADDEGQSDERQGHDQAPRRRVELRRRSGLFGP